MPSTDNSGSSSPLASIGRTLRSRRREREPSHSHSHSHSTESNQETSALDSELESFQQQVAERFQDLSAVSADELLSLSWIQKILSMFVGCLEDFKVILLKSKGQASKSPLDRFLDEFFERSVKALDICNAARDAIEKIRLWQKHLDIVLSALENRHRALSEGQFRRARKALMDLALMMLDERDSGSIFSHRNRSFGRHHTKKDQHQNSSGHSRSLSWSVSHSWSAAKQLQSISNSLIPPRASDVAATNGLAIPIFTISSVLMFVLWALVAAIPCQDRGLNVHFTIPRNFSWGTPFLSLYNRILEESKKRENRNANGLLKEICQVERCTRHMTDLVDSVQFPLTEEQRKEVEQGVQELTVVCDTFRTELDPLEHQIREVFRKIMNCRTEDLHILSKPNDIE